MNNEPDLTKKDIKNIIKEFNDRWNKFEKEYNKDTACNFFECYDENAGKEIFNLIKKFYSDYQNIFRKYPDSGLGDSFDSNTSYGYNGSFTDALVGSRLDELLSGEEPRGHA